MNRRLSCFLPLLVLSLITVPSANAALIVDGSFEGPITLARLFARSPLIARISPYFTFPMAAGILVSGVTRTGYFRSMSWRRLRAGSKAKNLGVVNRESN